MLCSTHTKTEKYCPIFTYEDGEMVCKAFLESLGSSNSVRTIMKSLTVNQQDLCFIYFLLKSGRPEDGWTAIWLKPLEGGLL